MSVAADVMSDARNRRTVWLALAVLAAALAAVWCYGKLVASREQAAAAAAELAECRRYADAIVDGRKAPSLASAEQPQAELGRRIERAAQAAKLPAGGVERIGAEQQARLTPQTVRRSRQVILPRRHAPPDADVPAQFEFRGSGVARAGFAPHRPARRRRRRPLGRRGDPGV